jgi:hypothetical protein
MEHAKKCYFHAEIIKIKKMTHPSIHEGGTTQVTAQQIIH